MRQLGLRQAILQQRAAKLGAEQGPSRWEEEGVSATLTLTLTRTRTRTLTLTLTLTLTSVCAQGLADNRRRNRKGLGRAAQGGYYYYK